MWEFMLRSDMDIKYIFFLIRIDKRNFLLHLYSLQSWVFIFMTFTHSNLRLNISPECSAFWFFLWPRCLIVENYKKSKGKWSKPNTHKTNIHQLLNRSCLIHWRETDYLVVPLTSADLILTWYCIFFLRRPPPVSRQHLYQKADWLFGRLASLLKLQTMNIYCQLWWWQSYCAHLPAIGTGLRSPTHFR